MMNGEDYLTSLRAMNTVVYINGERVEEFWTHPLMKPAFNSLMLTYDLESKPDIHPELHSLLCADSELTGRKVSRFLKIVTSTEDLIGRMTLQRALMRYTGGCFGGRCIAGAVINPLWSVTYEVDEDNDGTTDYHERFKNYMKMVHENGHTVMGNITDAKGDRSLPPHKQADPDMFVRVVEKRKDGIVVNGAKRRT